MSVKSEATNEATPKKADEAGAGDQAPTMSPWRKRGIVLAVASELEVPVKLVGLGEGADDLRDFEPEDFVAALFAGRTEEKERAGKDPAPDRQEPAEGSSGDPS